MVPTVLQLCSHRAPMGARTCHAKERREPGLLDSRGIDQPAVFDTDHFLLLEILSSLGFQNTTYSRTSLTTPPQCSFSWTSLCGSALNFRAFNLLSPIPLRFHLIIALNTNYADNSQLVSSVQIALLNSRYIQVPTL